MIIKTAEIKTLLNESTKHSILLPLSFIESNYAKNTTFLSIFYNLEGGGTKKGKT